jgi:hypothetical protein
MKEMPDLHIMEYEETPIPQYPRHQKRKGQSISPEEKQRRKLVIARRKAEKQRTQRQNKRGRR